MPYTRILIHAVWATKDRKPLMNKTNKDTLCEHIRDNAKKKNIHLLNVNGWLDHLHCFISLSPDQNILTMMNLIKGESSFWANRNLTFSEKFGWQACLPKGSTARRQDEYFAVSVSQSHFDIVNDYINKQEVHHQKKTFQDEYDEFIKNYEFER